MKCTLIIPAYNEAPVIPLTLQAISKILFPELATWGHELEIIVVDNASTDGTASAVTALHDPRITVLTLSEKGKGRAVRAGFRRAEGAVIGFTDADLAVSPSDVLNAFKIVLDDKSDIVIGSRFHPQSVVPNREWWRMSSSRIFNILARVIVGAKVSDTQCPLKVMNLRAGSILRETKDPTWFFDLEFLALARALSLRLIETPVHWDEHVYPNRKSKLSTVKDGMKAIGVMMRMRRSLPEQVEFLSKTSHDEHII